MALFTQINLKRLTKKLFVTMTSNIARKEHTKNHKDNYKRVKQKIILTK